MVLVRRLARPMLSSTFIVGGINSLRHTEPLADEAEPVTDTLHPLLEKATASLPISLTSEQLVQVNAAVHIIGGAALATGRVPRLSALALALTMIPTTLAGHRFWEESDPAVKSDQQFHFFKNVSLLGGLMLASVDTEGKPSLAWRARSGARRAQRSAAKQAAKTAKQASKLSPSN